ncbi:MAG: FG-GAP-like repeat-containing protein, partial [Chitinophagaceae bacterium]
SYAPITIVDLSTGLITNSKAYFTPTFTPIKTNLVAADFAAPENFSSNYNPTSITVGDLDLDGKPDLVVANYYTGDISIYRNTSTSGTINSSSFATKEDFYVGGIPTSIAIGDLDGDGKPEIVVANAGPYSINIFNNYSSSGSILFNQVADIYTADEPTFVAIGDLDTDGKFDLVVANRNTSSISIYKNNSIIGYIDPSTFDANVDFTTGDEPTSVAIGDINGDSKPDLAITNRISNTVSILQNTSTNGSIDVSSFNTKVDFSVGDEPVSIAIGDIDGDGKPDIAVANSQSYYLSVLHNTHNSGNISTSSFATQEAFGTYNKVNSIAIADLTGDGKPDLAVSVHESSAMNVFRNTSTSGIINSSSFAARVDILGLSYTRSVAVADFDGDGKPDLSLSTTSNYIFVLRNAEISNNANLSSLSISSGTLSPSFSAATTTYTTSVANTITSITVTPTKQNSGATIYARVNGGTYNWVTSGSPSSSLNLNVGSNTIDVRVTAQDGTTIKTYTITVTRAISNDANLGSLAISSTSLLPTFTGATTSYSASVNNNITSVTATPYCSNSSATVQVRINAGAYSNVTCGGTSNALNLIVGTNTIDIRVTAQDGLTIKTYTISLTRESTPPTITNISPTQGKIGDMVTITGTGFNTTTTNNIVYFGAVKAQVIAATATSISVAVPIGASFAPLTVLNSSTSLLAYSKSNFSPTYSPAKTTISTSDFQAKQDFSTSANNMAIALADVDGDGKIEVSASKQTENNVGLYRNTANVGSISSGSLAATVNFSSSSTPVIIAYGDLDNDGKLDMVTVCENANRLNIFKNTSTTGAISSSSFGTPTIILIDYIPKSVAIGDVDNDGKLDLAITNSMNSSISVLRNGSFGGTINFGNQYTYINFSVPNPRHVALADLDGDGKLEIVATSYNNNSISVLRNTATIGTINSGSFATRVDFTTGTNPNGLCVADFDGDSKPDIAVANYSSNTISIFRNTATSGTINSGSFASKVDFATATNPQSIAAADISGDEKVDIVVTNYNSNSVSVFQNTATSGSITTGSFNAKVDFTTGTNPSSIAIGDIDGDGKQDLAISNAGSSNFSVLRNNVDAAVWNGTSWSSSPSSTTDAFIASSNVPTTSFTCNNLIINNGNGLNSSGITANLNGNIVNLGNGITGTGNLNIESNSNITGNMLSFNGALSVNNTSTLNTNGLLTLSSNSSSTARIAPLQGTIIGNVTVERYFNGKRAWRFLTAPLSSNGNSPVYLSNSWQQQTHITGPNGTGLDAVKPNFSFLTHAPNAWSGVTNTQTTELFTNASTASNKAFAAFIRGNRSIDLNSIAAFSTATLSATGKLLQGTQTFNLGNKNANDFLFIGNPFASPIDVDQVYLNSGTQNINRTFYTWDPTLSITGGYVTISWNGVDAYTISPNTGTTQTQIIQSGQAFFARATSTGNASVVFEENDKSSSINNTTFGAANGKIDNLSINLQRIDPDGINTRDGVTVSFTSRYNKAVILNEDAEKLFNNEEAISINNGNFNLSIERRPYILNQNDTVFLRFQRLTANNNYILNFIPQGWDVGMQAFLIDRVLSTETPINLQSTSQNIQITANSTSANDRWMIVFKPSGSLPNNKVVLTAYKKDKDIQLSWKIGSELGVKDYELQHSSDGVNFKTIDNHLASNKSEYQSLDTKANASSNFYRVKVNLLNDNFNYSNVLSINFNQQQQSQFSLITNPVTSHVAQIKLHDVLAGEYTIKVIDLQGKLLYTQKIQHAGGTSTRSLNLNNIAAGTYQIVLEGKAMIKTVPLIKAL